MTHDHSKVILDTSYDWLHNRADHRRAGGDSKPLKSH